MKTPAAYLEEATSSGPWSFLNHRGCALRALELALEDHHQELRELRRQLHHAELLAAAIRNTKSSTSCPI